MNPTSLRLFVAVPMPNSLKSTLVRASTALRPLLPFRKWVLESDYHITLQFLGDTPAGKRAALEQALQEAANRVSPFSLAIGELGTFGRPGAPSILWTAIYDATKALNELQQQVAGCLVPLGFEPEKRRFHPHITLARDYAGPTPFVAGSLAAAQAVYRQQTDTRDTGFRVDCITLYETRLGQRPMYHPLLQAPFAAATHEPAL